MKDEEKTSSTQPWFTSSCYPFLFFRRIQALDEDSCPSSFIPHPCFSMSAQKLLDVLIVGFAKRLVCAAENNLAVAHHQNLAVD